MNKKTKLMLIDLFLVAVATFVIVRDVLPYYGNDSNWINGLIKDSKEEMMEPSVFVKFAIIMILIHAACHFLKITVNDSWLLWYLEEKSWYFLVSALVIEVFQYFTGINLLHFLYEKYFYYTI